MAATLNTVSVDTKDITLTVRMLRLYGLRMWLTVKLFQLAGMVAPITIELEWKE